ncbi:MFS transporter [Microbispora sp. GKU 823]|uniref:MFS transporter n=1 Tax=Microbispora sp. GKU 823 TaxID=1652100 RepID=UPI0009A43BDA|nr:MFS transporter [Microbispora sp. GKU 823]OPG09463.1 hypothetical protein B1L11_26050 [Microbispora sp. GKU 823]
MRAETHGWSERSQGGQEDVQAGQGVSLSLRTTLLVALAVFALEATGNFYDAQVPPLIQHYVSSATAIGLVMGIDNVLGIFLGPWIGHRSDRTRSRWGRRVPYLVVLTPVAALAFVLLPHAPSLPLLLLAIVVYALTANVLKPVATALLPDFVPLRHLSRGTAILKIGTSLTIIVSALISIFVIDEHPRLAFAIPAALMVGAVAVLAPTIHETRSAGYRAALAADNADAAGRSESSFWRDIKTVLGSGHPQARHFLVAAVLFLGAWAGLRSLLTPYGTETVGLTKGQAGGLSLVGGVAFILAAYPLAIAGRRYGHMMVARVGVGVFIVPMIAASLLPGRWSTMIALAVSSIGYASFAINATVAWWGFAPSNALVGVLTGIWTAVSAIAQTVGPAVVGALVDLTGWRWMLFDTGALALAALGLLWLVRERPLRA